MSIGKIIVSKPIPGLVAARVPQVFAVDTDDSVIDFDGALSAYCAVFKNAFNGRTRAVLIVSKCYT